MRLQRVVDFGAPESASWFAPVDDAVMGGESTSGLVFERDRCVFRGHVSLASGGGFASVRSRVRDFALAGFGGLELELAGDGKRYKLNLRLDSALDGVTYQAEFVAPHERSRVRIGFADRKSVV